MSTKNLILINQWRCRRVEVRLPGLVTSDLALEKVLRCVPVDRTKDVESYSRFMMSKWVTDP